MLLLEASHQLSKVKTTFSFYTFEVLCWSHIHNSSYMYVHVLHSSLWFLPGWWKPSLDLAPDRQLGICVHFIYNTWTCDYMLLINNNNTCNCSLAYWQFMTVDSPCFVGSASRRFLGSVVISTRTRAPSGLLILNPWHKETTKEIILLNQITGHLTVCSRVDPNNLLTSVSSTYM